MTICRENISSAASCKGDANYAVHIKTGNAAHQQW